MKKQIVRISLIPVFFLVSFLDISSQNLVLPEGFPAFTISANNSPDEGYIFLTTDALIPKGPSSLVIIDNYGTPVFYQQLINASSGFSPKDNGLLGFRGTVIYSAIFYVMDSSYAIVDSIWMNDYTLDSHDFLFLENGHYLIFGLDKRSTNLTAYGGEVDATVIGCVIRELDENKKTVFEWNSWNHFKITDTYSDLTKSSVDMVHPNTLEIDHDGNILLVSRAMNEVTKISRSSGNIMWRLGGKNNQFTFSDSAHMFSMPHDIRLLETGNYTLFDNGNNRIPAYSRAVEYDLDVVNKTIDLVWEYDVNKEVFSPSGGSARRLPSGNTILGFGGKVSQPGVVEVHPDGSKAFQLDLIGNLSSPIAVKYPWRTKLFEPDTYQIDFGEWDGYTSSEKNLTITNNSKQSLSLSGYSTRTGAFFVNESFPIEIPANGQRTLKLSFSPSKLKYGYIKDVLTIDSDINSATLIRRVSQQISLTGTQIDTISPTAAILCDGKKDIPLDSILSIIFSEPVRNISEDPFSYENIDQIIILKSGDLNGDDIPFDAVINTDKNRVDIIPDQALDAGRTYFISVTDGYADYSGNHGSSYSGSFRTIDRIPTVTIIPSDGSVGFNPEESIIIRFFEPVRNLNNTLLTQGSLDTLVILKSLNSEGEDVSFSASINEENTVISISPIEILSVNTSYYVSLIEGIEYFDNNGIDPIISEFTTGYNTAVRSEKYSTFDLFPNPGSGIYQIRIHETDNYLIQLYNMTGKIVYQDSENSITGYNLDISSFSDGLYFLKLTAAQSGKVSTVLLVKE